MGHHPDREACRWRQSRQPVGAERRIGGNRQRFQGPLDAEGTTGHGVTEQPVERAHAVEVALTRRPAGQVLDSPHQGAMGRLCRGHPDGGPQQRALQIHVRGTELRC